MIAVGRDIGITGDSHVEVLATAESFQLSYNALRDDKDNILAECIKRGGYWITPNGRVFSDITIEQE